MNYLSLSFEHPSGDLLNMFDEELKLRVDNYLSGTVYHRRNVHRRLFGGYYVEADPQHWKGAFTVVCNDVSFRQIQRLRDGLNKTLREGRGYLSWAEVQLYGHYVPDTLTVTSTGRMEDRRFQRNLQFAFEGKLL